MATDLERMVVSLEANIKGYEKSLAKAMAGTNTTAKKIEDRFNKVNPSFATLNKGLAAVAGFVSVDAIVGSLKSVIDGLSQVADIAGRAQVSTDFIQSIGFAASQAGGSIEDAGRAAIKFNAALGDLGDKNSYIGQLFKANGVDAKKFADDAEGAFDAYARLVANARTPTEALSMVSKVFGEKVGPKMLTTIQDIGNIGLPEFIKKMKEAGVVIDENIIKKGDEIGDAWNLLMTQMGTRFKTFIVDTAKEWGILIQAMSKTPDVQPKIPDPRPDLERRAQELREVIAAQEEMYKDAPVSDVFTQALANDRDELKEVLSYLTMYSNAMKKVANTGVGIGGVTTDKGGSTKPPPPPPPPPPAGPNAFERAIATSQKHTDVLNAETAAIDLGTVAQERAKLVTELVTAAKEANAKAGKELYGITEATNPLIKAQADAFEQVALKAEAAKGPLATFAREAANANENLQSFAVDSLRNVEDALIDIGKDFDNAAEAAKKMVASILEDLARLVIRQNITGPLASALSGGFTLPGRAAGGPVSAGDPYMVGEKGPELFVPKTAGNIVPNHVIGRGNGGGSSNVITLSTSIDARGSQITEARLHQVINERDAKLKNDIVPIVRQAQSRRL